MSQETGLHQICWHHDLGLSIFQNYEKEMFVVWKSPSLCFLLLLLLLQEPKYTNTYTYYNALFQFLKLPV